MVAVTDIPRYEAMGDYAKRYPELDPVTHEAFLVLLHTGDRLKAIVEQRLAKEGTSHGRFVVMVLLNKDLSKPLPASELATRIGVTKQTMTSLLDGLERDGFIKRSEHEADRRVTLISLTDQGRAFVDKVLPGIFKSQVKLMSALKQDEQKMLAVTLRKLWTSLEAGMNE